MTLTDVDPRRSGIGTGEERRQATPDVIHDVRSVGPVEVVPLEEAVRCVRSDVDSSSEVPMAAAAEGANGTAEFSS